MTRLSRASTFPRLTALALLTALACGSALSAPVEEAPAPKNSALDSALFYQLLVSEMSVRQGDIGMGFSLMLNAARKANDARLYQRAVELALAGRNGESALQAAQAWSRAFVTSRDANRYVLQILIGLNRLPETLEPIKQTLAGLKGNERLFAITVLPNYFARVSNKTLAAELVEQALAADLKTSATGPSAWATVGRMRLMADNAGGALEAVHKGVALDPQSPDPMALALNLTGAQWTAAEGLVRKHIAQDKPVPEMRMGYARKLLDAQRYTEAYAQMLLITSEKPDYIDAWLLRGSLELQDKKLATAESSLTTYITLAKAVPAEQASLVERGLAQAYLMLSQIAEQQNKYDVAQAYLQRMDNPQDAVRVQTRRAMLLARQGKLDEARALIRSLPETQSEDARTKISAEVQLLREYKQYPAAYQVLADAIAKAPQDIDLVYDQAMIAEKLNRLDDMEQLLRRVIAAKPDYHHAYNALGYSLADRGLRLPEARQLIQKALSFAPDDPFIVDSLAWVEFRSGNATEALRLLQSAFQKRPDAEISAHLGEVLWSLGQRDAATSMWKQGMAINPENETLIETVKRLKPAP